MKKYWILFFVLCITDTPLFAQDDAYRKTTKFKQVVDTIQKNLIQARKAAEMKNKEIYENLNNYWNTQEKKPYDVNSKRKIKNDSVFVYTKENLKALHDILAQSKYSTLVENSKALESIKKTLEDYKKFLDSPTANTAPDPNPSPKENSTVQNNSLSGDTSPSLPNDFLYWILGVVLLFIFCVLILLYLLLNHNKEIKNLNKVVNKFNEIENENTTHFTRVDKEIELLKEQFKELDVKLKIISDQLNTLIIDSGHDDNDDSTGTESPVTYYASYAPDGNILALKIMHEDLDWAHFMLIISPTNPNRAEFKFGDKISIERLMSRYSDIRYYCDNLDDNHRVMPVYQSGLAEQQNGRWVVTQKIKIQ